MSTTTSVSEYNKNHAPPWQYIRYICNRIRRLLYNDERKVSPSQIMTWLKQIPNARKLVYVSVALISLQRCIHPDWEAHYDHLFAEAFATGPYNAIAKEKSVHHDGFMLRGHRGFGCSVSFLHIRFGRVLQLMAWSTVRARASEKVPLIESFRNTLVYCVYACFSYIEVIPERLFAETEYEQGVFFDLVEMLLFLVTCEPWHGVQSMVTLSSCWIPKVDSVLETKIPLLWEEGREVLYLPTTSRHLERYVCRIICEKLVPTIKKADLSGQRLYALLRLCEIFQDSTNSPTFARQYAQSLAAEDLVFTRSSPGPAVIQSVKKEPDDASSSSPQFHGVYSNPVCEFRHPSSVPVISESHARLAPPANALPPMFTANALPPVSPANALFPANALSDVYHANALPPVNSAYPVPPACPLLPVRQVQLLAREEEVSDTDLNQFLYTDEDLLDGEIVFGEHIPVSFSQSSE